MQRKFKILRITIKGQQSHTVGKKTFLVKMYILSFIKINLNLYLNARNFQDFSKIIESLPHENETFVDV